MRSSILSALLLATPVLAAPRVALTLTSNAALGQAGAQPGGGAATDDEDEEEEDPSPGTTPGGPAAPTGTTAKDAPKAAAPAATPTPTTPTTANADAQRLVSGAPLYNPNVAVHIVERKAFADRGRRE